MKLFTAILFILYCGTAYAQAITEEKTLTTATGDLKGTLYLPLKAKKKLTVVVLQAGSGPTNRSGNSPLGIKANSYKLIAESLAQHGIATLLTDKRGIAESAAAGKSEANLRFDDYANDLADWIRLIKKDERIKKVFIAGHSEGSLVGMIAAQKEKVNGYISIAGAGERIDKILVWQVTNQSKPVGAMLDSMLTRLRNNQPLDTVPPYLLALLHRSIQPYMTSWMKHDPCEEIKKLTVPVLIIQGSTDIQTEQKQGEHLKACAPKATYVLIPGMNHVLKDAPADQAKNTATYADATLPPAAGLTDALTAFIKK